MREWPACNAGVRRASKVAAFGEALPANPLVTYTPVDAVAKRRYTFQLKVSIR
jgi:hypothetical protein